MDHWHNHGFGRWAVEVDGRLIGFGGVTVSKEFDGLNLSYHLHPDSWGYGFATELVREALAFSFNDLRAERVIGLVRSVNASLYSTHPIKWYDLQMAVILPIWA
jgi:RimJ/RimL family protein N-acetyltransferase